MYRIKFMVTGGYWVVQISMFGFFWTSVQVGVKKHEPDAPLHHFRIENEVAKFDSHDDASAFAIRKGIHRIFNLKESK